MQRPVFVGAAFAGPLHALRVCDGVPLQGELPGRAAGELVEVESGFPLLAPVLLEVALFLVGQLVVEGQADVQRVLRSLREPQGRGALDAYSPERGLALLVGRQLRQLGLSGPPGAPCTTAFAPPRASRSQSPPPTNCRTFIFRPRLPR